MNIKEAISARHAVRNYTDEKIDGDILARLQKTITQHKDESGLNIQLILDDSQAFSCPLAHYGRFKNVSNYLAFVTPKKSNLDEKVGYYGEKIVLEAICLGLSACWITTSYRKGKITAAVPQGYKIAAIIAIGYGENAGFPRKTKSIEKLGSSDIPMPSWFIQGLEAAQLAPTAFNQQKFHFELRNGTVVANAGLGLYTKIDLGVVKYHFEVGAGKGDWKWA